MGQITDDSTLPTAPSATLGTMGQSNVDAATQKNTPASNAGTGSAPPRGAPYEGLTAKERRWLLGVSVGMATINMVAAWALLGWALWNTTSRRDLDVPVIVAQGENADPNLVMYGAHTLNLQAHITNLSNKTAIIILAIGVGFTFLALGFGLFMLGVDGAFKLQASAQSATWLTLEGAAPGLLCFVLAAIVVGVGLCQPQRLDTGSFTPFVPLVTGSDSGSVIGAGDRNEVEERLKEEAAARRKRMGLTQSTEEERQ